MPVFVILLAFAVFVIRPLCDVDFLIGDADLGWHISAGKNILESGIPYYDPFSFTSGTYQWYNISWLWDIFAALMEQYASIGSMVVLVTLTSGACAAYLTYICGYRKAGILAVIVAFAAAYTTYIPAMTARPHLLSYLLILLFYDMLRKFMDGKYNYRILIALLPFFLLWVNSHGHFILGIIIIGAYGIETIWNKDWERFKQLLCFGIGCLLLVLVNPYGYGIIEGALRTTNGYMKPYISEWQPARLLRHWYFIAAGCAVVLLTIRRQKIADVIIVAFAAYLAQSATRFLILFDLMALPAVAIGLGVIFHKLKFLKNTDGWMNDKLSGKYITYASIAGMALLSVGVMASNNIIEYKVPRKYVPVASIYNLEVNYPKARILNLYAFGGYMIYFSEGSLKTFIDGRADTAFPPEVVQDYITFERMRPGWQQVLDKYKIDVVFFPGGMPVIRNLLQSGQWRIEFRDNRSVTLVRNK